MPQVEEKTVIGSGERADGEKSRSRAGGTAATGRSGESTDAPADAAASLRHIEKLLGQIRGALDATARDGTHREFSIGRTVGAVLQVVVAGLVALALLDWMLDCVRDISLLGAQRTF